MKRSSIFAITIVALVLMLALSASAATVSCSGVAAWSANSVSYAAGALVTYQGSEYKCLQSHTSEAGWDPVDAPALWSLVGTCSSGGATPTPTAKATPTATAKPTATATAKPTATATPKGTATATPTSTATPKTTPTATPKATPTATPTGSGPACWTPWVSTTAYQGGAQVSENAVNYTANYWTQGNDPATSSTGAGSQWTSNGSCVPPAPTPTPSPLPAASRYFAPYVDMGAWPSPDLVQIMQDSGVHRFVAAFVITSGTCQASWFGSYNIPGETTIGPLLSALRAAGGDYIVSFGGENGTELALSCTSASALQAQYQAVVTAYKPLQIDFDVEGNAVADHASIDLRNQALAALQVANPGLKIAYTLPVLPSGLTADGVYVLTSAKSHGVNVTVVNGMAMDFGSVANPDTMGQNAIDAVEAVESQSSSAGLTATMGSTPMIGANDSAPEVFTLTDAQTLVSWAQSNASVTRLDFWSINRDNDGCPGGSASSTCSGVSESNYGFSAIFNTFH